MAPLIVLLVSFAIFYLLNRFLFGGRYSRAFIGRSSMAIMLLFTGIAHFTRTEQMIEMMPDLIPSKEALVLGTGVIEIALALGLIVERSSRASSIMIILFFIAVLPANITGSLKRLAMGGMEYGPAYLFFRIPLQAFFILWIYYFGLRINGRNI